MKSRRTEVSEAPTNPRAPAGPARFDVADLFRGPLGDVDPRPAASPPLDEKLRQAYFWIVNHAIISPFYDLEFVDAPPATFTLGAQKTRLVLPTAQSLLTAA
jgi:hypothetical protein